MSPRKLHCETEGCQYCGQPEERRGVVAGFLPKALAWVLTILLGLLGYIGKQAGNRFETMSNSFQDLNTNMARVFERQSASDKDKELIRSEIKELKAAAKETSNAVSQLQQDFARMRRFPPAQYKYSPYTGPRAEEGGH